MVKTNDPVPSRSEIKTGQTVWAIEKRNYKRGILTEGTVDRILTSKAFHPRGIKVMFTDGTVARVQRLTSPEVRASSQPAPISSTPSVNPNPDFDAEFDLR